MGFLEILGSIVAGAGTFASILGVLLAKASRENGRATRELIVSENKAIRELIEKMSQQHQDMIEMSRIQHQDVVELLKRGFGEGGK